MREYETTVIVQPEISDEGTEAIMAKLDAVLDDRGSTRLMCSDLGKRKLAYEVRKFQKGHYYVLSFLDEGKVVGEREADDISKGGRVRIESAMNTASYATWW